MDSSQRRPVGLSLRAADPPGNSCDTARPFVSWGGLYALAWEAEPDADPVAQFTEALAQGRLRAEERLTGAEGLARLPR